MSGRGCVKDGDMCRGGMKDGLCMIWTCEWTGVGDGRGHRYKIEKERSGGCG